MTNLIGFDNTVGMGKLEELRAILKAKVGNKETTQTKLAQESGVDGASISRFLKEKDGLSVDSFFKVAEYVGAKFFWPHELPPTSSGHTPDVDALHKEVNELTKENAKLLRKLVTLYEAERQAEPDTTSPPRTFSTSPEQSSDNGG